MSKDIETNQKHMNQDNRVVIEKLAVGKTVTLKYKVVANGDNVIDNNLTSTAVVTSDEGGRDEATLVVDISEKKKEETPKTTTSNTPNTPSTSNPATPSEDKSEPVKTGDSRNVGMYLILMAGAAATIMLAAFRKKKED